MFTRLNDVTQKLNIIYQNQFGFQKNKSTELAVHSIISNISKSFEDKENAYCICLDFAKAFDTVDDTILLKKLEYYGIGWNALEWFKGYLTDRHQYTETNGTLSTMSYINCGVPQSSILGPLLFLLYINDIVESTNVLKVYLFADDTTIFSSHKPHIDSNQIINDELQDVTELLDANKLTLNVSKS